MELLFWITFFLVLLNTVINIFISNSNMKDRKTLDAFVAIAEAMSKTYTDMALKYNEVGHAFNETKRITDNQADFIQGILSVMLTDPHLAHATLEWLTEAQKGFVAESQPAVEFPSVSQI